MKLRRSSIQMPRNPVAAAILLLTACSVWAQDADSGPAPRQTVSVVPRIVIRETITNNVSGTQYGAQSDGITEINPGVSVNIQGARLKTYFDYSVNEVVYTRNTLPRHAFNALNTNGSLEAVDNWLFINFSGAIAQQAISAFGAPSADATYVNVNQTEVSKLQVSPVVRGQWGNLANYEASYSRAVQHSAVVGGTTINTSEATAKVIGHHGQVGLGWSVEFDRQQAFYGADRAPNVEHVNLGLPYAITPQFSVSVSGGRESSNYVSVNNQSYSTGGFGVTWTPSELTKLIAVGEHRSFGSAHNVGFESRTARTIWRFNDVKNASATLSQTGGAGGGTLYDLLFSQFASVQPDPVARAQLVNAYLQANGMPPNVVVTSGFVTSTLSLQRRQDLSFVVLGARDTLTLFAARTQTSNLDPLSPASGDLANGTVVTQRGLSANWAHRLTPDSTLSVTTSKQVSTGSTNAQEVRFRSLYANITSKVGRNSALTFGARHAVASGNLPYVETAVTANLNVPF